MHREKWQQKKIDCIVEAYEVVLFKRRENDMAAHVMTAHKRKSFFFLGVDIQSRDWLQNCN